LLLDYSAAGIARERSNGRIGSFPLPAFFVMVRHAVKIYKTIILPVVFYGCETWPLTLREENTLRVFDNRVLRRIFGLKKEEVTGEWRKLHNVELRILYSFPNIIRQINSRRMFTGF
jgi:hypothetical protein